MSRDIFDKGCELGKERCWAKCWDVQPYVTDKYLIENTETDKYRQTSSITR